MAHHDASWKANFTTARTVVLDHPLPEAFRKLARGDDPELLERMMRLNPLGTSITILHSDTIAIATSTPFLNAHIYTLAPYGADGTSPAQPKEDIRLYQRQWLRFEETVPFVNAWPSLVTVVPVTAVMVWDEESKQGLWESRAQSWGMVVRLRRTRVFEEVDADVDVDYGKGKLAKTKITEVVEVKCPWWVEGMVQSRAKLVHRTVMEGYHTLF